MSNEQSLPERRVVMADGTVLDAEIGQHANSVWIWFKDDTTLVEAAVLLSNPEKTASMTFVYPGREVVHTGYTVLTDVRNQGDGKIEAKLINPAMPNY